MNTALLKEAASRFGADLVGVAPMERFADVPAARNPLSVFPQAKSMIVLGRSIPRGTLRAMDAGSGRDAAFRHFGFATLEDNYLAKTTYDVCIWIEARGFEAVPMFGYDAEEAGRMEVGVSVAPGKPAPNVHVDWRGAAHAAGLGAVGRHGLFITPEFGTRQRFAMILSDFAFEPDAVAESDFCADCDACVAGCPLGALRSDGARDNTLCLTCKNGAVQTNCGRFNTVERIGAACGRACLAALESRGATTQTFNNRFREQAGDGAWHIDILGRAGQTK